MTEPNPSPMKAAILPVTPLQQNCSLIWCTQTNKAALIDPGGDLDKLKAGVAKAGVELEKILITHGHLDHCGQAGVLARETKRQADGVGRDIAEESQAIREGAQGEDLKGAIRRIIDRAATAERELSTASSRIDRLQRDLEEARNKALVDELTGIPNRRATRAMIQDLEIRKVRYCTAIIDIDHFKVINDTYGHAVGDRALKLVANALTEALAPWPVSRWGGEEFLVIAETPDAGRLAEKVTIAKNALADRNLKLRETDEPMGAITFSAGVAVNVDTSDETLCRADNALYEAKKSGRNKVLIAPESGRVADAA